MCLACQEEALYRAYLDYLDKKAKAAAAATVTEDAAKDPAVCDDVKDRAAQEATGNQ
jgi:hypothetical protein